MWSLEDEVPRAEPRAVFDNGLHDLLSCSDQMKVEAPSPAQVTIAKNRASILLGHPATDALLALVLLLAAGLRVTNIHPAELWRDDSWVGLAARAPLKIQFQLGVTARGFNLILARWIGLNLHSTTWALLPAFVASIAAVAATYWAARVWNVGPLLAAFAAATIALSPIAITYATRVKQYESDCLISALLLGLTARSARSDSPKRLVAFFFCGALGIYISAATLPVFGTCAIVVLFNAVREERLRSLSLLLTTALAGFLIIYWWLVLRPLPPSLRAYWHGLYVTSRSPSRFALQAGTDVRQFFAGFASLPPLVTVALFAAAIGCLLWRREWALLVVGVGPLAIAFGLSALSLVPLGTGRTDMYLYPGVALVFATSLKGVHFKQFIVAALCGGLILGLALHHPLGYPPAQVREAEHVIASQLRPGDRILVSSQNVFSWALYSPIPPTFMISRASITGYTVSSRDSQVLFLAQDQFENGQLVDACPTCPTAARVWWVGQGDPEERALAACGYARERAGLVDLWILPNHQPGRSTG